MKTHPTSHKTREERFEHYLALLGKELDHLDRIKPFREYLTGLLLPGKRKSIEPLAAQIDPSRVCAEHQSLHHFIAAAAWSDRALLRAICRYALPALLHLGEIECWVIDDTGFPKRGKHSVGVARQYCGQLGKIGYFPTKEPKASLCLRKLNPISYLNQFNISQKQGLEGAKSGKSKVG